MKKFEYKDVEITLVDYSGWKELKLSLLNELGNEGWELVCISPISEAFGIFKREIKESKERDC